MKLWVDDVRPAPPGWVRATSVEQAKIALRYKGGRIVEIMSLGSADILKWLKNEVCSAGRKYIPIIHIHTTNSIERANMEAIVSTSGWRTI